MLRILVDQDFDHDILRGLGAHQRVHRYAGSVSCLSDRRRQSNSIGGGYAKSDVCSSRHSSGRRGPRKWRNRHKRATPVGGGGRRAATARDCCRWGECHFTGGCISTTASSPARATTSNEESSSGQRLQELSLPRRQQRLLFLRRSRISVRIELAAHNFFIARNLFSLNAQGTLS
jgi:hypothetical protein